MPRRWEFVEFFTKSACRSQGPQASGHSSSCFRQASRSISRNSCCVLRKRIICPKNLGTLRQNVAKKGLSTLQLGNSLARIDLGQKPERSHSAGLGTCRPPRAEVVEVTSVQGRANLALRRFVRVPFRRMRGCSYRSWPLPIPPELIGPLWLVGLFIANHFPYFTCVSSELLLKESSGALSSDMSGTTVSPNEIRGPSWPTKPRFSRVHVL